MAKEVNHMYFSKEMVDSGEMTKLISLLCAQAYSKQDVDLALYNDIRIRPEDCGAFRVEWVQLPWNEEFGGHFCYVDEDEVVCFMRRMPDETYEYFASEEEYRERLAMFHKDDTADADIEDDSSPEAARYE